MPAESSLYKSGRISVTCSYILILWTVGYLACARCSASGVFLSIEPVSLPGGCDYPLQPPTTQRCPNCSGAGKV